MAVTAGQVFPLEVLEFTPETHEYRLNGVVIPGVTEVMRFGGLADAAWFDESSAWRGAAVHLACQLDDENDLDPATVDETVAPYLEAWRQFKAGMLFFPQGVEVQRHGILNGMPFAGRPDRIGMLGILPVVLDLKSGAIRPETAIQLAAYSHLTNCLHRVAVRLGADSKYAVQVFPVRERLRDLRQFQSALANWWWKQNRR